MRGSAASATRNSDGGGPELVAPHQRHAEIVVRLHVSRLDADRALKVLHRVLQLSAILIEQAQVVVHLGAPVVPLEQRAVVRQRAVEVADPLVVQRAARNDPRAAAAADRPAPAARRAVRTPEAHGEPELTAL